MEIINKFQIAELILRMFCGIIFLYQGYDKLFKVKISGVTEAFMANAHNVHISSLVLKTAATFTSIVEFTCGLMLIIGLFKTIALTLLGLDMIIVGLAFSMLEPVWDMRHVFPRLLLVFFLLILPGEWEFFSLDYLFKTN
jgi:putative oxidoreductase